LTSYAFTQHDGRRYASQDLIDGKINAQITVKFLKGDEDGKGAGGWAVRVQGKAIDQSKLLVVKVMPWQRRTDVTELLHR
jgi:hypothetical protein